MGFAVPLAAWFRGPLRDRARQAILGPRMLESGFFDPAVLRKMLDAHERGASDHGTPLWTLLMFDEFLRLQQAS
jgi:asparagine synthase (glutamine-hydrolysing)